MRKRQTAKPATLQPSLQPQLLSIPEVARALSIGQTKVYDLIKTDGLPTIKLGRMTRISVASLQQWIQQREQAS
jgi:excisionase family DNA binding protein